VERTQGMKLRPSGTDDHLMPPLDQFGEEMPRNQSLPMRSMIGDQLRGRRYEDA
jgi:hypothetical protein